MNELERTEVTILVSAALDLLAFVEGVPEIIYDDDPTQDVLDAIKRVLALVYA